MTANETSAKDRLRLLIFIVAYNAEKTLSSVLGRIPEELKKRDVEVLVIDDHSKDNTFHAGLTHERDASGFKVTILRTTENQGYGGNQKLGYQYAINGGFDAVALLHGDGQYAPEELPNLLGPLLQGEADAVFGSRMLDRMNALRGGMPLYKWIGNQALTHFQNLLLRTSLSEFHSGYRLYSVEALKKIPFQRNSNDFHFDTEIIIQFVLADARIKEVPIPTYYGDEVCHVNGLRYAWKVCEAVVRSRFHQRNLFYDRKYDFGPVEETYDLKLGMPSSHTMAVDAVQKDARVLDVGCGQGLVAYEMARKAAHVTGIDRHAPVESSDERVTFLNVNLETDALPADTSSFQQIFLLDIIEHLRDPEVFMERLRSATVATRPEVIITTANIGFLVNRFGLLLGQFNYGRKGILDRTHCRLFTFGSLRELLEQCGYSILDVKGIPAPYPKAIGYNGMSAFLLSVNNALIRVLRGLFSYQIWMRVRANPSLENLLAETILSSEQLKRETAADE